MTPEEAAHEIRAHMPEILCLARKGSLLALKVISIVKNGWLKDEPNFVKWCLDNMEGWGDGATSPAKIQNGGADTRF